MVKKLEVLAGVSVVVTVNLIPVLPAFPMATVGTPGMSTEASVAEPDGSKVVLASVAFVESLVRAVLDVLAA